jgi:hypothetical protein
VLPGLNVIGAKDKAVMRLYAEAGGHKIPQLTTSKNCKACDAAASCAMMICFQESLP